MTPDSVHELGKDKSVVVSTFDCTALSLIRMTAVIRSLEAICEPIGATAGKSETKGEPPSSYSASVGGDFAATVLSETPGFLATEVNRAVTLSNTTGLAAVAQMARSASQPLNLILSAANELVSGSVYARPRQR